MAWPAARDGHDGGADVLLRDLQGSRRVPVAPRRPHTTPRELPA